MIPYLDNLFDFSYFSVSYSATPSQTNEFKKNFINFNTTIKSS